MKNFLKNPWIVGIGVTVIGGLLLSFVSDLIQQISLLSTITIVLSFVWNCIISVLTFEIKVWWLIVAIVVFVVVLWIIAKYHDLKHVDDKPEFLSYTQDFLLDCAWEWTWGKNYDGKYQIENLCKVCIDCKTPLTPTGNFDFKLKCPRCKKTYDFNMNDESDVEVLIYDNVKKNKFNR